MDNGIENIKSSFFSFIIFVSLVWQSATQTPEIRVNPMSRKQTWLDVPESHRILVLLLEKFYEIKMNSEKIRETELQSGSRVIRVENVSILPISRLEHLTWNPPRMK